MVFCCKFYALRPLIQTNKNIHKKLYSRSSHPAIAATWTAPSASPISNHTFYGKTLRNCMSKFLLSCARHRNSLHWSFTTQCFRYYLNLSTCASTSSEIHSSFCYRRKRSNNVSLVSTIILQLGLQIYKASNRI